MHVGGTKSTLTSSSARHVGRIFPTIGSMTTNNKDDDNNSADPSEFPELNKKDSSSDDQELQPLTGASAATLPSEGERAMAGESAEHLEIMANGEENKITPSTTINSDEHSVTSAASSERAEDGERTTAVESAAGVTTNSAAHNTANHITTSSSVGDSATTIDVIPRIDDTKPSSEQEATISLSRQEDVAPPSHEEHLDGSCVLSGRPTETLPHGFDDLRTALAGFYRVHNPERLANLDTILAQYAGKEALLIERLEQKYSADFTSTKKLASGLPHNTSNDVTLRSPGAVQEKRPAIVASGSSHELLSPRHRFANATTDLAIAPSPNYISYLADQIRSNVEGFLPASNTNGIGSAGTNALSESSTSATMRGGRRDPGAAALVGSAPSTLGGPGRPYQGSGSGLASVTSTTATATAPTHPNGAGANGKSRSTAGAPQPQRHSSLGPGVWGSHVVRDKEDGSKLDKVGEKNVARIESSEVSSATSPSASPAWIKGERRREAVPEVDLKVRLKVLQEERTGLMATCRRLQGKAEVAMREAAAVEELREASQHKVVAFAERAAGAERHARETAARLRALESGQASLQAEKEESAARCAVKHAQLQSAVGLQIALRSQLEGLLEVAPPPFATVPGDVNHDAETRPLESWSGTPTGSPRSAVMETERRVDVSRGDLSGTGDDGLASSDVDALSNSGGRGHDPEGSGNLTEANRRCSILESMLKASRLEASTARRARDAAENTVRGQRDALGRGTERIVELEACLTREREDGERATLAASALEKELEHRLTHLHAAEVKLADHVDTNIRLEDELRKSSALLETASAARKALLTFCRQERTAVEREAAEHVSRAEERAAMRAEEGFARGLELARMAKEAGEEKATTSSVELDRLGKALFASRAELAGSEARVQSLRQELERAAGTIAEMRHSAASALIVPATADAVENGVRVAASPAKESGDGMIVSPGSGEMATMAPTSITASAKSVLARGDAVR